MYVESTAVAAGLEFSIHMLRFIGTMPGISRPARACCQLCAHVHNMHVAGRLSGHSALYG